MNHAKILWVLFAVCTLHASDKNPAEPSKNTPYDFPVKTGTAEWRVMSLDDARKASQIPKDVAQSLTTDALVESCMNYPFLIDYLLFDDTAAGLRSVTGSFYGFEELKSRKDAGKALAKYYHTRVTEIPKTTEVPFVKLLFIQEYVATPDVMRSLRPTDKNELATSTLRCMQLMRTRAGPTATEVSTARLFMTLMVKEASVLITHHGTYSAEALPKGTVESFHGGNFSRTFCDEILEFARQVLP